MLARVENNHAPIAYVSTNVVNLLPCVGAVRQKAAHNTWHTQDCRVQQYYSMHAADLTHAECIPPLAT